MTKLEQVTNILKTFLSSVESLPITIDPAISILHTSAASARSSLECMAPDGRLDTFHKELRNLIEEKFDSIYYLEEISTVSKAVFEVYNTISNAELDERYKRIEAVLVLYNYRFKFIKPKSGGQYLIIDYPQQEVKEAK